MPEGDTIWRTATALGERLAGRRVTAARPAALHRLTGRHLISVDAVGKHLYMRFEPAVVLHSHMRMTGAWHLYPQGQPWRRSAHRATAVLEFEHDVAVLFAAPVCELVPEGQVGTGLGPDILGDDLNPAAVIASARESTRPTIAEVLLDQRVCSGIGNIYRCDALWYEGTDPLARPARLDDAVLGRIYRRARDLMQRNAVGDAFALPPAVHGRAGRGCRRCGATILRRPLGRPSRILYWCPGCQPPAPAGPGIMPPG